MHHTACFLRELMAALLIVVCNTTTTSGQATTPVHPVGKTIFEDNFDGRSMLGPGYSTARAKPHAWTIRDGVLIGTQTYDDHGAVMRKQLSFDDLDVRFRFRFNGGSRFNFVIDDQNEKSVHAGHICRVSISPKRIMIGDDKLGAMNLKVRAQRQATDLPDAEAAALAKLLKRTQASTSVTLTKGQWYLLRVSIQGKSMTVELDGKRVVKLTSGGIGHTTKTQFGMTVNGSSIDFDNLKVYGSKETAKFR